jgi:two-component system, sensor histidine kinase
LVREATRLFLTGEGYRVVAVRSLTDAWGRGREPPRILVVMTDYHLSKGDTGVNVIGSLREVLGPTLKAVLVTGDTSSALRVLAGDRGVCIASKPVDADALLSMLKGLLEN